MIFTSTLESIPLGSAYSILLSNLSNLKNLAQDIWRMRKRLCLFNMILVMKIKILINNSKQKEVLTEHLKHLLHICYFKTITNKAILVHPCRITIRGLKPMPKSKFKYMEYQKFLINTRLH